MGIFDMFKRRDNEEQAPSNIAPESILSQGGAVTNPIQAIGRKEVQQANKTLNEYKSAKQDLESRILENEKWYKLRHWQDKKAKDVDPTSAWLFNCIENKHADAMDNYPIPTVLPREQMDKMEAETLSSILPVIFDQNDFEATYSSVQKYKLKFGTGAYGIFWDSSLLNGLGDIAIKKIDLINLYWEAGVTDIQKSRNVFHIELYDNDILEQTYPQLLGKLGTSSIDVSKYAYDEKIDTSKKSAVVDWYYKKMVNGRKVLHYVKYVNDEVLYASENDPNFAERGWYDHGKYPFEIDTLFEVEGSIAGLGYIDVSKPAQEFIDKGNHAIMQNMLANSRPRFLYSEASAINLEEYADTTKDFVRVAGAMNSDSIMPIQGKPLNDIYVSVVLNKVEELKEVTGNRDVSTGGTTGGVTAASAIAAQMEAGSKLSRNSNKAAYRVYRRVCLQVIELIRQFYDNTRKFRIIGQDGMVKFVEYSNANIKPMAQGMDFGVDMGFRLPLFDIEVAAQKQSPYSKLSQNELALQFYQSGFFNPQLAEQALMCLSMMDFDRKSFVEDKIRQNSMMYQMMMMQGAMMGAPVPGGRPNVSENEAVGGENAEPSNVRKAKERVAESTSPV